MNKGVLGLVLVFAAQVASGAIQYEFHQTSRSDVESMPASDFSGRAIIDGHSSRVDFLSGSAYPPGTFVISTNGSRSLTFVDPAMKSYTEFATAALTGAIGAAKITIENLQSNVIPLDDHPIIAGMPTNHYQLTLDYDIMVVFGNVPLKQRVHTVIDKWTTTAFGDVAQLFLLNPPQTGNKQIDDVLALETTKIQGFPLRQTVQMRVTSGRNPLASSKLKIKQTRTRTVEMRITSIREVAPNPAAFVVPAMYKRAEPLRPDPKKSQLTILSMEPATK